MDPNYPRHFEGCIDDVRVYNCALTSDEVLALYHEGGWPTAVAVPPTAGISEIEIPAAGDSYIMGDGSNGPNVSETISYDFKMSKYEITNTQFAQFIADGGYSTQSYWTTNGWSYKQSQGWTQPGFWTDGNYDRPNQPVAGISLYEAEAFCNWLSIKQGLTPAYGSSGQESLSASGYRLPTEVEWEYAAAKGGPGQAERIFAWGDTWDANKVVDLTDSLSGPADVGSLSPGGDTPQGLADIGGNLWEWCADNDQSNGSITSGTDRYYFTGDSTGATFVVRSGSWARSGEGYFDVAFRGEGQYPNPRWGDFGFRVVRTY